MTTFIFILLASMWLTTAALAEALRHRRPWQLVAEERRFSQVVRKLEGMRHSLVMLAHLLAILSVVQLTLLLAEGAMSVVALWVLICALAGVLLVQQSFFQEVVLKLLVKVSGSVGSYGQFVPTALAGLEPLAARLFADRPTFRNREELARMVQHHHHTHRVLSATEQRQLKALLTAEDQSIQSKIIPLSEAAMVKVAEHIGPLVLSELHNSPYGSFVVYDKRRANIVGVLDQAVAVSHATQGAQVAKVMEERVVYMPRQTTLRQAIQTFIETSSPLSVIIDDEHKPVGVLYVQDILRDLFETTDA